MARVVCFPSRELGATTEQITVAYTSGYYPKAEKVAEIHSLFAQTCMMISTGCRPLVFAIMPKSQHLLPTTTLGKIPNSKMRTLFEKEVFSEDVHSHQQSLDEFKQQSPRKRRKTGDLSGTEALLRKDFADSKGVDDSENMDPDMPIFEMRFTSMDLIRLKRRVEMVFPFPSSSF